MRNRASRVVFVCLMVGLSACQPSSTDNHTLRYSGVMEATQATVVAELGGRVIELAADEGDTVQAGQVMVRLDGTALQAQVKQAQAAVSAAEANLAQVKTGTRKEELAVAQAALTQAQAERDGARAVYSDTVRILHNPQQILAQLDAARTGAKLAEENVALAQSKLAEAKWWRDFYDDDPGRRPSLDKQITTAQHNVYAAQAQLDGANAQIAALEALRRAPVELQMQVNSAQQGYSMTLAGVGVAAAALAELEAGPTLEEVAVAEAQLHQAQAQLKLTQAYVSRAVIRAPLTGRVSSRSAHVGETIQPGAALLTVADLEDMSLVVYVPQTELPRVKLGAAVDVFVDAYPGQAFEGRVSFIARQAQFASRDIQERADRANVVFGVKIRLPNADQRLKSGMNADAVIRE